MTTFPASIVQTHLPCSRQSDHYRPFVALTMNKLHTDGHGYFPKAISIPFVLEGIGATTTRDLGIYFALKTTRRGLSLSNISAQGPTTHLQWPVQML